MSIPKEIFERACKETLDNYTSDESSEKTFDALEKIASNFSDTVMKRALQIALKESKSGQKKTYVQSVANMLDQLDSEKEPF